MNNDISTEFKELVSKIQFLSPNEPITTNAIKRIIDQIDYVVTRFEDITFGLGNKTITLWNKNGRYSKGDIVIYLKDESKQVSVEQGKRRFVFLLMSLQDSNVNTPNYDIVNELPDFSKSSWKLLNPSSYLLQDLSGMKKVVEDVFKELLEQHVKEEHGLIGSKTIQKNLLNKDYSNLTTSFGRDKFSTYIGFDNNIQVESNGLMEMSISYGFESQANPLDQEIAINDKKYYYQKSPIIDESDKMIFAQKYVEDDLFSVNVHTKVEIDKDGKEKLSYLTFNNLRYGTNIFRKRIRFQKPFYNDEYCVFFDSYDDDQFVFGLNKQDLQQKTEPTYDAIVSRPMIMNKTNNGFDIILPIHTYFNSIQKYQIGVPWKNEFRLHVIGRYR